MGGPSIRRGVVLSVFRKLSVGQCWTLWLQGCTSLRRSAALTGLIDPGFG